MLAASALPAPPASQPGGRPEPANALPKAPRPHRLRQPARIACTVALAPGEQPRWILPGHAFLDAGARPEPARLRSSVSTGSPPAHAAAAAGCDSLRAGCAIELRYRQWSWLR